VAALLTTDELHVPLGSDERAVTDELQRMLVGPRRLGHDRQAGALERRGSAGTIRLDELLDAWFTLGDEVARTRRHQGRGARRQAETIAGSTEIEPLPPGVLGDRAGIDAIATRLGGVTARATPAHRADRRRRRRFRGSHDPRCGLARAAALADPRPARPRLTCYA
jgi:hypothetical protein